MFGSTVLEVGIGMASIFFFMSLIASALIEALENFLKSRSRQLEIAIAQLLPGLTREFYTHPIIAALYPGKYEPGSKSLPSYIPRESFSLAVLDLLSRRSSSEEPLSVASLAAKLPADDKANDVQRVVASALNVAGADISRVRGVLEQWFDGTMDRCSGWYTRRSGRILMVVGLLAAIFFNVDAVTVAERLSLDRTLREAVLVAAQAKVERSQTADDTSANDPGAPSLAQLSTEFRSVGYPIGWTWQDRFPYPSPQSCRVQPAGADVTCHLSWRQLPSMILSWMTTALAVMLGAPFWFDLMNKLVVIRSTVKPKEKSPDEND